MSVYILLLIKFFVGSLLYYFTYKRTALRLGDERFYKDSDWLQLEFEKRALAAMSIFLRT